MPTMLKESPRASFGVISVLPVIERAYLDVAASVQDTQPDTLPDAESLPMPLDLVGRVVLVATDGSPAAASATRVADALAREHGAIVHAISVLDTRPAPLPPPIDLALAMADAATGPAVHAQQVASVRDALSATVGRLVDWPVHVMIGTPATAIAQEARRLHAALIVMGLRRHGVLDRAVHDETTLSVIRRAGCPVLAVIPSLDTLPRRVLAAVDFGRASITAARRAATVMDAGGTIVLAYVPPLLSDAMEEGETVIRQLGIEAAFDRAEAELAAQGVRVDRVVLHHKLPQSVAKLVIEHSGAARADLITAGSMRHGRLDRWLLGSVSTELVRDGRRSVLIVPPTSGTVERDRRS
jgi:nucleotide-binding universal stress UspA family protein